MPLQEETGKKKHLPYEGGIFLPNVIEKGPYETKAEKWTAVEKIVGLQTLREKRGDRPIPWAKIEEWTGMTKDEVEGIKFDPGYQTRFLARGAVQMRSTMVEAIPAIRFTLLQTAREIMSGEITDKKEIKEFQSLCAGLFDKWEIPKIDPANADSGVEMDTIEAIKRGVKIIEQLTGKIVLPQKFVEACVNENDQYDSKDESGNGEFGASGVNSETSKDGTDNRSNTVVDSISIPENVTGKSENVPVDDNLESVGQDGHAGIRLLTICDGAASDDEDAEERDGMDISGEE
jgi:hypothetical protein